MKSRAKPTRLLIVGAFPAPGSGLHGGIVSSCRALMASSLPTKVDVAIVDSTGRAVPPPPLFNRFVYSWPRIAKFVTAVPRLRPCGVLIFASTGMSFVEKTLFAHYASMWGCRVMVSYRGGAMMDRCAASLLYRWFTATMVSGSFTLLCQGERWMTFFKESLAVPSERCLLLKNWTASPGLLSIGRVREYDAQCVQIMFMGWIDEAKGILDLLQALAIVRNRGLVNEWRLTVAGQGSATAKAKDVALGLNIAGLVSWLGWVDGPEKLKVFQESTIFVLPSYVEGLPNAMIEAMAAGLPVIVTPVGNVRDAVSNGVEGIHVSPGDVTGLAHAIERLALNRQAREAMGRAAHRRAAEDYSVEPVADAILEIVKG